MNFLYKLERKLGKYAIRNLMLWIIVCYAVGFTLQVLAPDVLLYFTLEPYYIFRGQIWRLITWIIIPESGFNVLFSVIMLFFYYNIGTTLERIWGSFRFNLYMIGGILVTDLAAIVLYLILGGGVSFYGLFSTTYINMSLFLAYATYFPDNTIYFMMILPIKMKWLGVAYAVLILYEVVLSGWVVRTAIIASILNFIIFFLMTRNLKRVSPREMNRKIKYKQQVRSSEQAVKHKCAVCGRTEKDGENLVFRYCSKCEGNYEYCQDHLFTHEHIKHR